jgi:hypothetical protein
LITSLSPATLLVYSLIAVTYRGLKEVFTNETHFRVFQGAS